MSLSTLRVIVGSLLAQWTIQPFVSVEQTGTGAAQNIAHGLGSAPSRVLIMPTDTAPATVGVYTATFTSDATNVVATVTSGKKYLVAAWP